MRSALTAVPARRGGSTARCTAPERLPAPWLAPSLSLSVYLSLRAAVVRDTIVWGELAAPRRVARAAALTCCCQAAWLQCCSLSCTYSTQFSVSPCLSRSVCLCLGLSVCLPLSLSVLWIKVVMIDRSSYLLTSAGGRDGCTDASALNFSPHATTDDGSCVGSIYDLAGVFEYHHAAGAPERQV